MSVSDAHNNRTLVNSIRVLSGSRFHELLADGVALDISGDIGVSYSHYNDKSGIFDTVRRDSFDHYVHLSGWISRISIFAVAKVPHGASRGWITPLIGLLPEGARRCSGEPIGSHDRQPGDGVG